MKNNIKRKRGAPRGNRNAVKHGYYSTEFNKTEQFDFNLAAGMEGISTEIALLRYQIKKAVSAGDLSSLVPLSKAIYALDKLIRTHHKLFGAEDNLQVNLESAIDGFLASLGISNGSPSLAPENQLNQKTNNSQNEAELTYNKKQISESN